MTPAISQTSTQYQQQEMGIKNVPIYSVSNNEIILKHFFFSYCIHIWRNDGQRVPYHNIGGLVQERRNSFANAMEWHLPCIYPLMCFILDIKISKAQWQQLGGDVID